MKKQVLFTGCSYTAGTGFDLEKNQPELWVNLLHNHAGIDQYHLINASAPGRSNSGIFFDTVDHLINNKIDLAFVAWTSSPRYEVSLGLELYDTGMTFTPNSRMREHRLNDINYTVSYLESINDRFTALANLHLEILNLVKYINVLIAMAAKLNTRMFFINALCHWDAGYFEKVNNVLPNQYTPFTQKLINIENRDDQEIHNIYNKIHNEYTQAGGIQSQHWLNLYNSLRSQRIDTNNDGVHPGIQSNQLYYNLLVESLKEKLPHSV
jgi:hypothetical protein